MKLTTKSILLLLIIALSSVINVEAKRKITTKRKSAVQFSAKRDVMKHMTSENVSKFFQAMLKEVFSDSIFVKIWKILEKVIKLVNTPEEDLKWEYKIGTKVKCIDYKESTDAFKFLLKTELTLSEPKIECSDVKKEEIEALKQNCQYLADNLTISKLSKVTDILLTVGSTTIDLLSFGIFSNASLISGVKVDPLSPVKYVNNKFGDEATQNIEYLRAVISFSANSPTVRGCFQGKGDVEEVCQEAKNVYEENFVPTAERYGWHHYLVAALGMWNYFIECTALGQVADIINSVVGLQKSAKTDWTQILGIAGNFILGLFKSIASIATNVGMIAYHIYRALITEDMGIKFESWGKVAGRLIKLVISIVAPGSGAVLKRKARLAEARVFFRLNKK